MVPRADRWDTGLIRDSETRGHPWPSCAGRPSRPMSWPMSWLAMVVAPQPSWCAACCSDGLLAPATYHSGHKAKGRRRAARPRRPVRLPLQVMLLGKRYFGLPLRGRSLCSPACIASPPRTPSRRLLSEHALRNIQQHLRSAVRFDEVGGGCLRSSPTHLSDRSDKCGRFRPSDRHQKPRTPPGRGVVHRQQSALLRELCHVPDERMDDKPGADARDAVTLPGNFASDGIHGALSAQTWVGSHLGISQRGRDANGERSS